MSAPPASHAEWDAYVEEVRSLAAARDRDYFFSLQEWTPSGKGQWKGLSVIRTEKSPSFYFYEGRGWYDFGSQQGGDLIELVMLRDSCSFREAVDTLARFFGIATWDDRKAGLKGPAPDPEAMMKLWHEDSVARRIFGAATALAHLCHELLPSMAREHLEEHYGLAGWYIDFEKFGYCPDALWEIAHAYALPYTDDELLATGWFRRLGGDKVVASLGGRLVFPYWKNSLCHYAIGREYFGRAKRSDVKPLYYQENPWDAGKYKKLPVGDEDGGAISPFVQNDVLWNEDCLRRVRDGQLLLSEGVTDAASLAMLGFAVVSPVTTAYRNRDVERVMGLLRHYRIRRVVILNDNDTTPDGKHPGLDGARKMAAGLWAAGFDVRIARLPRPEGAAKIDINEIIAGIVRGRADRDAAEAEAKAEVARIVAAAESYPAFLIGETPQGIPVADLEPWIADLGTLAARMKPLEREDLFAKLHRHLVSSGIPKRPLRGVFTAAVAKAVLAGAGPAAAEPEIPPSGAEQAAPAAQGDGARSDGGRKLRGAVRAHEGGYYERETAQGIERLSTFRLEATRRVVPEAGGPDWVVVRVYAPGRGWDAIEGRAEVLREEWIVPPRAWISRRAFAADKPDERMVFNGSDEDLGGVCELLTTGAGYDALPRIRSTTVLGRHVLANGSLRFVLVAGTLGPDGRWMAEPDLIYQPDGGSSLSFRLPREKLDLDSAKARACAKELFEGILTLHEPEAMAAIASWMMGTVFGPVVRAELGVGPLLNVFGSPGSGKSTLMQLLWPMFAGVLRTELLSCTSSLFVYARDFSACNALFIILDELRQADMGRALEVLIRILRRVYSGDTEMRGRADQGVNHYLLIAFLVILGEERLGGDHALNERSVSVGLDGNWVAQHPEARAAMARLSKLPLHQVSPLILSWSLSVDARAMMAEARTLTDEVLVRLGREVLPARVRLNLVFVAFGALGIDAFALAVGARMPNVSLDRVMRRLIETSFEEDGEGEKLGRVRNNFDLMLIDAATMANLGLLADGKHYLVRDGKLYLWLAGIEAARAEWRRAQGLPGHMPRVLPLARSAAEMLRTGASYILDTSARIYFDDDKRMRCVVVELSKIPTAFGIESFPSHPLKSYEAANKKAGEDMRERWRKN